MPAYFRNPYKNISTRFSLQNLLATSTICYSSLTKHSLVDKVMEKMSSNAGSIDTTP